ncbi:hypothetical protein BN946_scf184943.g28 [Trametes cinnabarina]|uniref:Tf2-1-like SH3-like domain-containing protein n=1 Tax=Pycnoporus cinnabarinus TaxID=5643 RepID=A0A060SHT5_PYCCI|nr:hypothetical protein BN946_scf184943.g28 [Trametes cinnabarina]
MSSAYHPESDGSTERANRTVSQMLRQCIGAGQRDWVSRLPAIEFAINLARSDSTGYAPFFLNTGRMPRPMIWDDAKPDEFPGVRVYAQRVKAAVMAAHDSIIAARVKQTRDANRRRRPVPFAEGDLVYVSTKNIALPKGYARKLAPKFIGPYRILRDFKNNSYRIELPPTLKRRGIHNVFHASLLRVHEPNDDRLFPGRLDTQVFELEDKENEWAIDKIVSHRGSGRQAMFEALWKSGDRTWVPFSAISHLQAMNAYLEAAGVSEIEALPEGSGVIPDDPQIFAGAIGVLPPREPVKRGWSAATKTLRPTRRTRRTTHRLLSSILAPFLTPRSTSSSPSHPTSGTNHKSTGEVLATDLNTEDRRVIRFSRDQVRFILDFDALLRSGRFDPRRDPVPAGYETFGYLWDLDFLSAYGLAPLPNPANGTGRPAPNGEQIPSNLVLAREAETNHFDPQFVQGLVAAAAQTFVRQQRVRDRAVKERQDKRRLSRSREGSDIHSPAVSDTSDAHSIFTLEDGLFDHFPAFPQPATSQTGLSVPGSSTTTPAVQETLAAQSPQAAAATLTGSQPAALASTLPPDASAPIHQTVNPPVSGRAPQSASADAPVTSVSPPHSSDPDGTVRDAQPVQTGTPEVVTTPAAKQTTSYALKDHDVAMDEGDDVLQFD